MAGPARTDPEPGRPLRADAARNRARVLEAARAAFAESGLEVGVDEIARRAHVGKGTLYRRFPTKEALVRAIFDDVLDELERAAGDAAGDPDPWQALVRFLRAAAAMQAANQGFYDVVAQRLGPRALTVAHRDRMRGIVEGPLRRAQAAGAVRVDLRADDVPMLLRMVGATTRPMLAGHPGGSWPRYLALLLDGIRPAAATPLP